VTIGGLATIGRDTTEHSGPSPLSRIIYEWLREAILTSKLPPGQVLRQEELAARFNSSRVPLREALSRLEAEGLVVLRPRRGFAVISLDSSELLELLQLRVVIEEHAGYVATLARTEKDVRALESPLRAMGKLPTKNPTEAQREQWSRWNRRFHEILIASSGRRQLRQVSSNLQAKIEPFIRLEIAMGQEMAEAQGDHEAIFSAFREGDPGAVAGLCRRHCERTAVRFVRALHAQGLAGDLSEGTVLDLGPVAPEHRHKRAVEKK
jgi:DNA-binding GntR family transcriptional regulator